MRQLIVVIVFGCVACGPAQYRYRYDHVVAQGNAVYFVGFTVETERYWVLRCVDEGAQLACVELPIDGGFPSSEIPAPAGWLRNESPPTSPTALAEACERGDGGACTLLGLFFAEGREVRRDAAFGCNLFSRACELGDRSGCVLRTQACAE